MGFAMIPTTFVVATGTAATVVDLVDLQINTTFVRSVSVLTRTMLHLLPLVTDAGPALGPVPNQLGKATETAMTTITTAAATGTAETAVVRTSMATALPVNVLTATMWRKVMTAWTRSLEAVRNRTGRAMVTATTTTTMLVATGMAGIVAEP